MNIIAPTGSANDLGSPLGVLELSRHFLADKDGLVALLKVAFDESGTHDDSPIVTVGGYMGRPRDWQAWTKKWNVTKRPIKVFHAKDCANFHGEFDGWNETDRNALVAKLLPIIASAPVAGIVIGIDKRVFNARMEAHPDLRRMFGNTYTACLQWAMQSILDLMNQVKSDERIAFVHEVNPYKGEALSAFDEVNTHYNPTGVKLSLAFAGKDDYVPLQAADILAYEGNKRLRNLEAPERRAWMALNPNKNIWFKYYGENSMNKLIQGLADVRDGKAPIRGQFLSPGDIDRLFPPKR